MCLISSSTFGQLLYREGGGGGSGGQKGEEMEEGEGGGGGSNGGERKVVKVPRSLLVLSQFSSFISPCVSLSHSRFKALLAWETYIDIAKA